jgi:hypothetical protein
MSLNSVLCYISFESSVMPQYSHVEYVAENEALGEVSFRKYGVFPCHLYFVIDLYSFICYWPYRNLAVNILKQYTQVNWKNHKSTFHVEVTAETHKIWQSKYNNQFTKKKSLFNINTSSRREHKITFLNKHCSKYIELIHRLQTKS